MLVRLGVGMLTGLGVDAASSGVHTEIRALAIFANAERASPPNAGSVVPPSRWTHKRQLSVLIELRWSALRATSKSNGEWSLLPNCQRFCMFVQRGNLPGWNMDGGPWKWSKRAPKPFDLCSRLLRGNHVLLLPFLPSVSHALERPASLSVVVYESTSSLLMLGMNPGSGAWPCGHLLGMTSKAAGW